MVDEKPSGQSKPAKPSKPKGDPVIETDDGGDGRGPMETLANSYRRYELAAAQAQAGYAKVLTGADGTLGEQLNDCYLEVNRRLTDAYQRYFETMATLLHGTQEDEQAVDAMKEYVDSASQASDMRQPIRRWQDEYISLMENLREAYAKPDAAIQAQKAFATYTEALYESLDLTPTDNRMREAHQSYVAAVAASETTTREAAAKAAEEYSTEVNQVLLDENISRQLKDAWDAYCETVNTAAANAHTSCIDAYVEMVEEVASAQRAVVEESERTARAASA